MTIPQRFMDNSMPVWLRRLPGLDDGSREILLEIDAAEVAAHVPGYAVSDGHIRENLRLRAVRLTDVEIQRHREPSFALDAWDGTGLFKKRAIRRDDSTGYYFVVQSADYSISWQVFSALPEAGTRPHDFLGLWLGGCLEHRGAPPVPSGIPTSCRSFVVLDDLAINYTLGLVNLKHTAAIRTYLTGLAEQWSRN